MGTKRVVTRPKKFNTDFLFKIYELAKTGMSDSRIADALGITRKTLSDWKANREEVQSAFRLAKDRELRNAQSFQKYVYDRLSPKLQRAWDELHECEKEENSQKRIEALFRRKGLRVRQQLFVHSLVHANFNPSKACQKVGISRGLLDNWIHNDPDFAELLEEINWHKGNYFEDKLVGLCESGDTSAILFANRTFNKDRGYGNKTEVSVTGQINSVNAVVSVDELDLPIEVRKAMLKKLRERQTSEALSLQEHVEDADYTVIDTNKE